VQVAKHKCNLTHSPHNPANRATCSEVNLLMGPRDDEWDEESDDDEDVDDEWDDEDEDW